MRQMQTTAEIVARQEARRKARQRVLTRGQEIAALTREQFFESQTEGPLLCVVCEQPFTTERPATTRTKRGLYCEPCRALAQLPTWVRTHTHSRRTVDLDDQEKRAAAASGAIKMLRRSRATSTRRAWQERKRVAAELDQRRAAMSMTTSEPTPYQDAAYACGAALRHSFILHLEREAGYRLPLGAAWARLREEEPDLATAVALRYLHQLTLEAAAERLEVGVKAIRWRSERGLDLLVAWTAEAQVRRAG